MTDRPLNGRRPPAASDEAAREARAVAAELRLAARVVEVERAEAEGRLFELAKAIPSVHDQLRDFIE